MRLRGRYDGCGGEYKRRWMEREGIGRMSVGRKRKKERMGDYVLWNRRTPSSEF